MKLGGNQPPGDNPLLFSIRQKKNGTSFDIFYLGKYALGIHLSLVRNLHECCHCKKVCLIALAFKVGLKLPSKYVLIYLENRSKGPFIIINVLKFRFLLSKLFSPTPNFDFKILMPFPYIYIPATHIKHSLNCLLSTKCTATLLKDRFNGEYYKILQETTKPFVKKHSVFIDQERNQKSECLLNKVGLFVSLKRFICLLDRICLYVG